MKIYNKVLLIVLVVISIVSCTKTADVEIPDNEPELVVASFISPQDSCIRVILSWSQPVYYNTNYNSVLEENATVVVTAGNESYLLSYDVSEQAYKSELVKFEAGDVLNLMITYGELELFSECVIPDAPKYEIEYLGKSTTTSYGEVMYEHRFNFVCRNTNYINYYRLHVGLLSDLYLDYTNVFLEMYPGEEKEIVFYDYNINTTDYLSLYVLNVDENYFNYHESLINQYDDLGIFSEPALDFNNIEGGLGVFSAFNLQNELIRIE